MKRILAAAVVAGVCAAAVGQPNELFALRLSEPSPARSGTLPKTRVEPIANIAAYLVGVAASQIRFAQIEVERVTNRRNPDGPGGSTAVGNLIEVHEQTVLWLRARNPATGRTQSTGARGAVWTIHGDSVTKWGSEPGFFLADKPGQATLTVRYAGQQRAIKVNVLPREIQNRHEDVDVWFIERLPRIDFDGPNNGLPVPGSQVTWRAHVFNWGKTPAPVRYTWRLNGEVLAQGERTVPVGPPGIESTHFDLPWTWTADRHNLSFQVEVLDGRPQLVSGNKEIEIQTNAITLGLWVERSIWEFMHEHQHRLPSNDANSFAGWGQRMVRFWNQMFKDAVWEHFPDGITERVRLDRVVVVPDFALPLAGGLPSNNPDLRDKTIDMMWGVESDGIVPGIQLPTSHWWSPEAAIQDYNDGVFERRERDRPFWIGLGYIHELAHARYLIDAYGFNVHSGEGDDLNNRLILVTDEHGPILGRYMPIEHDIQHWQRYSGQMGGNPWIWSAYEAMCWNRVAGRRARGGNYNAPSTIGEFLQDIPNEIVLRFVDTDGNPLSNAMLRVYRAQARPGHWYGKLYPDTVAIQTQLDSQGRVTLDRKLWAADGVIRHTYGVANGVALLRVTHQGRHYFRFEEVTDANIAYNLGHRDRFEFTRVIPLRTGNPDPSQWNSQPVPHPLETFFGRRPSP
ncbi:MAG: hypothetical protein SNJ76_06175 [Fimbriimonadaceae bacterium]